MKFTPTEIPAVLLITPEALADERGFFMETFRADLFDQAGIRAAFIQDNHSSSGRNVLRGLHFQIHSPQGKLVRVVAGEVFDVSVDLRRGSPTFGRWVGTHLSAENKKMLWVPPGFAHGFLVLSANADVIYKVTAYHAPEWDRTLAWDDPSVAIEWPLPAGEGPILSPKDACGLRLEEAEGFDEGR